jgi:hypothetical protein
MNDFSQIVSGIFLVGFLHTAAFFIGAFIMFIASALQVYQIGMIFAIAGAGIGVSQLIYIIPLLIRLIRQQEWGLMKGVIIGAVLTALLNGGCWLLVFNSLGH